MKYGVTMFSTDHAIHPAELGRGAVLAGIVDLRVRAEQAGRDPSSISIAIFAATSGSPARIDEYRVAGVERAMFGLPPRGRDAVLRADRHVELIRTLAG